MACLTVVSCGLVAFVASGCMAWRTTSTDRMPEQVRVHVRTGPDSVVEVVEPRVEGDWVLVGDRPDGEGEVRVQLDDVQRLQGRVFSFADSFFLSVIVVAVLSVAIPVGLLYLAYS